MTGRRAFTLLETIIAMVMISIALPPIVALMHDASRARIDAANAERASWLAAAVMEHICADVASADASLGPEALADSSAYLTTPVTGLNARLQSLATFYAGWGISYSVTISGLVSSDGTVSGDADLDVFRSVEVEAAFPDSGGTRSVNVARSFAIR